MLNEKELDQLIIYVTDEAFQGMDYCNPLDVEIAIRNWFRLHQPDRLNPEDTCIKTYYRSDDGVYEKLETCICDSQIPENK